MDDVDLEMALLDLCTFYKNRNVTQKHFSSFREISGGNTTEISTEKRFLAPTCPFFANEQVRLRNRTEASCGG